MQMSKAVVNPCRFVPLVKVKSGSVSSGCFNLYSLFIAVTGHKTLCPVAYVVMMWPIPNWSVLDLLILVV